MLSQNHTLQRRGLCLVLAAASGVGKSTVARALRQRHPDIEISISATTRPPRPGEADSRDYHFLSDAAFDALRESNGLLEWAEIYGHRYGTPRAPVAAALERGADIIFDIDWQGHRQLRASLPGDVVGIYLLPPSAGALRARLQGRATDSPETIARRLAAARADIAHWPEFDHLIVNDDLQTCVSAVEAVLLAARTATTRQVNAAAFAATLG